MPKYLIFSLFSFLFFNTLFGQKVEITGDFPQSEKFILGIWKSNVISYYGNNRICILDTLSKPLSRKVMELNPQLSTKSLGELLKLFVHENAIYEIYYINDLIQKGKTIPVPRNILVKRDIETFEIITQKDLPIGYSKLKMVKIDEEGFFVTFCTTDQESFTNSMNFPAKFMIPQELFRFDFELEQIWDFNFSKYGIRENAFLNELSIDNDGNVMIPLFRKDDESKNQELVDLIVLDITGKETLLKLEAPKFDGYIESGNFNYNRKTGCANSLMILIKYVEDRGAVKKTSGYYFVEWNSKGTVLKTKTEWFLYNDFVSDENREYLNKLNLKWNETDVFEVVSNEESYHLMNNGDRLYISDKMALTRKKILNSKILLMVSSTGEVLWKKFLVHDNNYIYNHISCFVSGSRLSIFSTEFRSSLTNEQYSFRDVKDDVNGVTTDLMLRVFDLENGNLESIQFLYPEKEKTFLPVPFVFFNSETEQYILRYRNSKKNIEKLGAISF
nr:hypothetical protein [uncultured Fluviicola sp.]